MSGSITSFSLLALDGNEWLASHPDCFLLWGKTSWYLRDGGTAVFFLQTIKSESFRLWPSCCSRYPNSNMAVTYWLNSVFAVRGF
jgi:hypothetical protein